MMNRRRKFLSGFRIRSAILLWIVLVCLVSAGAAAPSPDAQGSTQEGCNPQQGQTCGPSSAHLNLGDAQSPEPWYLQIPVVLEEGQDIGAAQIAMYFYTDKDFLSLDTCDPGDIAQGSLLDCNYNYREQGQGTSVYTANLSLVSTRGISGPGILLYLTFRYNGSFSGTKEVDVAFWPSTMFTVGGQDVFLWTNSSLHHYYIAAPDSSTAGDVNGDGKVTAVDALMALRMTTGSLAVNMAADMDKSGKVQVKDVLFILQKASMVGAAGGGGPRIGNSIGGVMTGPPDQEAEPPEFTRMNLPNPDQGRPAVTLSTKTRDVDRSKTA